MKKLLNILTSLSLVTVSSASVVACRKGIDFTNQTDDAIKILSVTSLNTEMLVNNGVKIGGNVSQEEIRDLIKMLGIDSILQQNSTGSQFALSFRAFIMANQLLGNISSSIPNYGWINTKLQWQSSHWGFSQLFKRAGNYGVAMNASGWLPTDDDFSLSVTFLDEDKQGWKGGDDLFYARVNINKRIVVDDDGILDVEQSNPNAVWYEPGTDLNSISAADVVEQSTSSQTKNRGNVYQGFVNSSQLIKLEKIYDPDATSVPSSIFTYSPSTVDLVNNMFVVSNIVNKVLENNQQEIADAISNYLLDKPIYIGESVELEHVERRIRNQIYIQMFIGMLKRYDAANDFSEEDLSYANTIMPRWWLHIKSQLTIISELPHLTAEQKAQTTTLIEAWNAYQIKDREGELSGTEISTINQELTAIIKFSKDFATYNSAEVKLALTDLVTKFSMQSTEIVGSAGSETSWNMISDLSNFGANPAYIIKVRYYFKKFDAELDHEDKLTYNPDANKDPISTSTTFISDAGFYNVFYKPRINYLLKDYSTKMLASYKGGYYVPGVESKALLADVFDTALVENNSSFDNGQTNTDNDWFKAAGYLTQFGVTDKNKISIPKLADLVSNNITQKFIDAFSISKTSKYKSIADYDISFDNMVAGQYLLNYGRDQRDDDKAFEEIITGTNPFMTASDLTNNGSSKFRDDVWEYGLSTDLYRFDLIFNKLDSYGFVNPNVSDKGQWWNQTQFSREEIYAGLDIYSETNQNVLDAFKSYWDQWVRNNKNNLDHKF